MNQFYITTSIPYVNGEPHLGHALEFILADSMARYARELNKQVIFSTGTDEHGSKIYNKAKDLKLDVQDFVNQTSDQFKKLAKDLNVSNNRFVRTTDQNHIDRVQLIWQKMSKDFYKSKYIGWYCDGDEAYFTDSEVRENNGICPNHNKPFEKIEEENYFFPLSKYSEKIYQAIIDNKFKIYPKGKRNEMLSFLNDGLEDISVSRPIKKVPWGIEVPGDKKQTIYVWFEALLNYITVLGYPEHSDFQQYWPANIQVVGKDIARFHAIILPAILMSLDLELPQNLYIHGFVSVNGKKMGKSLGNSINPTQIIKKYGVDPTRYYFLRHISSSSDGDFSFEAMDDAYNNELANELGNLIQRSLVMINKYLNGEIGSIPPPEHDIIPYKRAIEAFHLDQALDEVFKQVRSLNQYIDETKPWVIAKQNDKDHLKEVLEYLASSILEIAFLLKPFLPETSKKIEDIFKSKKLPSKLEILFPKLEEPAKHEAN